jgi:predicted HTH transcriptional regulator
MFRDEMIARCLEVITMTKEDIIRGESKNLEFKAELPKDTKKYTRTVIAFANSQGGNLIIGVDDRTRDIIGVDSDNVFQVMDSIANAVSASCVPQIVPDISFQTIDGKTVVVARIEPGANRPYYLKTEGKEGGTYIRVAGTTRHASPEKIKVLEMERARISWDELTCIGYTVTDELIEKLCGDIMRYREEAGLPKRNVTRTQLINWKLLKEDDGNLLASNAFALLTAESFPFSKTQCAVFAGTDRGEFIDKRDFEGPLYEQIEAAYSFVLRNIRLGAKVEGLLRREKYELPPDAIREMIINALCHRNFLEPSFVQVAVYADRLEVTSPGGLYNGLTLEQALNGYSKQRNRIIAEVFNQMGLIAAWGTGLRKIQTEAENYHLSPPEIMENADSFRINLYRVGEKSMPDGENSEKDGESSEKTGSDSEKIRSKFGENLMHPTKKLILYLLSENSELSASAIAKRLSLSPRAIEKHIKDLRESGLLIRHGPDKGGYWEVTLKDLK